MSVKLLACTAIIMTCWTAQIITAYAFSGGFTESKLHQLAIASSLSYLSLEKMASSPYYDTSNLEPLIQVIDPESASGATIFRVLDNNDSNNQSEQQNLIVACRGSANPKNFGTNLKFNLVPATRLSQNNIPDNAMVHEGFQAASVGLWKVLAQPLMDQLDTTTSVIFSGHSLGGATALLCSVHYNTMCIGPSPNIITFGGPRLCNPVLARHIRNDALAGSTILHLIHSSDPVLANNQQLWDKLGLENVGVELECEPNKPIVFQDDVAPKKKSPFQFAWNIVDHCKYMVRYVCRSVSFFMTQTLCNRQTFFCSLSCRVFLLGRGPSCRRTTHTDILCQSAIYSNRIRIVSSQSM